MEPASAEQSIPSAVTAVDDGGSTPTPAVDDGGSTPKPLGEPAAGASEAGPKPPGAPSPFPALSPADGTPLALVEATDLALLPEIVARARKAQADWAKTPVATRAATLA